MPTIGAPPAAVPNGQVGVTPNPLSAPVAVAPPPPPVGNAVPAPLAMPPGTISAPAPPPPNANGHPMPTHYQHQSQAMAPAPPLVQQQQQRPPVVQGMQHAPPQPTVANGQPQQPVAQPVRPPQPMQHPQLVQQAPVQQQAAQARPQPLNGGWQSDKDVEDRRKMIAKIVQLLRQRKPNAPQEWLNKLPQMAKRLEESLYRSAPSFDAYNDISTLKQRLQQLAMNIGMKTKRMQHQQQAQVAQQQQVAQTGQPLAQPPQQPQYQQRTQQQQQQVAQQRAAAPIMPPKPQQGVPLQQPHLTTQQQQPQQQQRQMVNMSDINPNMATQQQQAVAGRAPAAPMSQANYATAPGGMAPPPPQQQQGGPVAIAAPAPNIAAPAASAAAAAARQPSDRQQVLRHQQQRLLLLRHAAKCPHQDNQCPVTPHCAGMKRLWKHIAECKDQKCLVPHCVSSRYVLSHYHRCKDVRCPVCGPVREAIHRSHEKQKQMQALKQGHQAALKQQNQLPAGGVPVAGVPAGAVAAQGGSPPLKRQKTTNGQYVTSQVPQQQPGQPGQPGYPPRAQQQQQQPQYAQQQPPPHVQQPYQQQAQAQQQQPAQAYSQQKPLAQPSGGQPAVAPGGQMVVPSSGAAKPQVVNPNIKAGYVYSHPPNRLASTAQSASAPPGVALSNGKVLGNAVATTGPRPQEDHTLINCFTLEEIETHIKSLDQGLVLPVAKLKTKFGEVLKNLQSHSHGWVFNSPVDPVELGLPDYFEVIERPMDLGTVKRQLDNGIYRSLKQLEIDVNLTFGNAMLYNPEGSVVWNMAKELQDVFVAMYEVLLKELHAEEEEKRKNGDACSLCGCEKLLFEPPVFYCNGLNCRSKRIRRNSYFYVGGNNQFHWCQPCYDDLKESKPIELAETTLKKSQLDKKKNNEIPEESWVQCDRCERWIHQICALFNTRQNTDQRSEFVCPSCTIVDRKKKGNLGPSSTTPMAEDLPRTILSEKLEKDCMEKLKIKMAEMSKEKAEAENISLEKATELTHEGGGQIYVRQLTSMSNTLEVRPRMKKRYSFKDYPSEFKYRCKCIVVFQNLDGVDVILFGLYVYEHDETNAPPNQRAVYVSYLDSVHYMRPRKMRTFVYHELLISYLDYVRCKGYNTAHIWACPPLKGDDYILFAKPEDQKIPKDDRLRQWYIEMLKDSQKRGIVGRLTNAYDLYFANGKKDATVLPYMEGDYFPAEMENIIKDMEEGKNLSKKPDKAGKKGTKEKKKKSKVGARGGTRSSGLDQEALLASGIVPEGVDVKSLKEGGRDWVMKKLGETINPMKESFLVAFLNWDGQKPENQVVPKEVIEYRKKHGIVVRNRSLPLTKEEVEGDDSKPSAAVEEAKKGGSSEAGAASSPIKNSTSVKKESTPAGEAKKETAEAEESKKEPTEVQVKKEPVEEGEEEKVVTGSEENTTEPSVKEEKKEDVEAGGTAAAAADENTPAAGKFAAMAKRKKDLEVTPPEPDAAKSDKAAEEQRAKTLTKDSKGRLVKVIDDDDEEMDCEFLNNRQLFLNLCQGNHYQFDSLRRAKHTSMMVLWHLHNRDAPKFVQQCAVCSREILQGKRYHCPTCADFDQCIECLRNPAIPRHPHQLQAIPVGAQQSTLTAEQRKERQRSIALHMTLLLHASTCRSVKCTSANCAKMKGLLKHGAGCKVKANGGCNVCKRIWALLQIHARQCKTDNCPVPNCMAIRERYRQLQLQQQAMDDRRRQMMNQTYHQQAR
eukprot:CAMPEP_0172301040 /NCGR_PEP_ID=MMETSP1058-20130122/3011_1 /TAXON_ID=83371 /ORGANISM="Detonula confervacea, Strain CCMP 353" /LENGTH=1734 /DNA_ID=CAMNT_0013011029 /DNA_START=299 /DNA_END=5503 /DNA_ORIENTATION=+